MSVLVKNLRKAYGQKQVLDNLGFALDGPALLTGPSGTGKTTLLRILMGLEKADSGTARIQGRVAVVFQEDRLIPQLTAGENIRLTAGRVIPEEELAEAFTALNLSGQDLTTPCGKLSGGQKRRVALLRALLCKADCLLLDEPFTGLDEENLQRALAYTAKAVGKRPCLLVCHDAAAQALDWEQITLR